MVQDILDDDDKAKLLDRPAAEEIMENWLSGFRLTQPSDYFLEHPTDDYELACNIQTEKEFMI